VTLRALVWMSVIESGLALGPAVIWGAVLCWRVTLTEADPSAVPPRPSLTAREIANVVVVVRSGGVNVTLCPLPEIVPPLAVHVYVSGSRSISVATAVMVLVCRSVMESGSAVGPTVIWGGVLCLVTLTEVAPPVPAPSPSLTAREIENTVCVATAGGVNVTLAPVPVMVPPLAVHA
jgi:hypothetical protein